MTNSPPANVKIQDYQILASGIDTLHIALYVSWYSDDVFNYLETLKEDSKNSDLDKEGILKTDDSSKEWKFTIKPHGSKGFAYLLESKDYTLKIGKWLEPRQRPNIMIEIRSEALWAMGAHNAVKWVLELIKGLGTRIIEIKPSRIDLCVDMVIPSSMWSESILDYLVTRAKDSSSHRSNFHFTGISIGKGQIMARIYDKGHEIVTKSKKLWMFDIWGIDQIPENLLVIRIEIQLRREALKSFLINQITDLFELETNLWAHLTTEWIKFQDRPGAHHTQRKTLDWWQSVQGGYKGSQQATPAVRSKAARINKEMLAFQTLGTASTILAIQLEEENADINFKPSMSDCLHAAEKVLSGIKSRHEDLTQKIKRKRSENHRVR